MLPVLTMPAGDITHPVPDLTGYITEGQIVLGSGCPRPRHLSAGRPAASLSRLMRSGAGKGRTRDDHLDVAAQLLAALARARQLRELAELIGESALAATDQLYLKFGNEFERRLVDQRPGERRDLEDTLDRCWQVAHTLPTRELTMLSAQLLAAHPRADR